MALADKTLAKVQQAAVAGGKPKPELHDGAQFEAAKAAKMSGAPQPTEARARRVPVATPALGYWRHLGLAGLVCAAARGRSRPVVCTRLVFIDPRDSRRSCFVCFIGFRPRLT